jgi:hypothetical protein
MVRHIVARLLRINDDRYLFCRGGLTKNQYQRKEEGHRVLRLDTTQNREPYVPPCLQSSNYCRESYLAITDQLLLVNQPLIC